MNKFYILFLLPVLSVAYPEKEPPPSTNPSNNIVVAGLSDPQATCETNALYAYLKNTMGKALLFGQQYSTYYRQDGTDDFCTESTILQNTPSYDYNDVRVPYDH